MKLRRDYLSGILFGKENESDLEKKVFIITTIISVLGSLIGIVWDLFLDMPRELSFGVGFFMLAYFLLYYNARFRNRYNSLVYVFISLMLLSFLYMFNGGLNGSIPSLYIVFVLIFVTICSPKYQLLTIILTIVNLLGLFVAEHFFLGDIIYSFINDETRELDLAFGYIVALILCFIIIYYFKKAFTSKNNQLDKVNKSKDLLFNIIAHDLRSPFNSILGFSGIMAENSENLTRQEFQQYAQHINKKSQKNLELLDSLLQWGKLQMNNIQTHPQVLNLKENVSEVILLFRDNYKQKNIEISNLIPGDINVFVDKAILNTILRNLLSNAIKFTTGGGEICILAEEADKDKVFVIVRDNGIGMGKEMLKNLFRFDVSSNRSGTAGEESVGLGLIITKELIDKFGENLIVESELNKGSTFKFSVSRF